MASFSSVLIDQSSEVSSKKTSISGLKPVYLSTGLIDVLTLRLLDPIRPSNPDAQAVITGYRKRSSGL